MTSWQARCTRRAPILVVLTIATAAPLTTDPGAQSRGDSATDTWLEQYYADYRAMSAAPTGAAMDRWLAHYAPYAFFEDPTIGQSGMGPNQIRKPYVEAFTGPWGPVRWTLLRRVISGEWTAVEGWLDGTQTGTPVRTRFTTWLKIRNSKIVHQIDYLDYAAIKRQVEAKEAVSRNPGESPSSSRTRDPRAVDRALRVADEFYRRYEAMPVLASAAGIARFVELLTPDFRLEDRTARIDYQSRDKLHKVLTDLLATGDYGPMHWEIDRRITDGAWVAVEGTLRGVYNQRPFATRFSTWLQVRGDRMARQIDYVDYATFRKLTTAR